MQPTIQEDGTVSMLAEFEREGNLTEDQLELLKEIADEFSPEEHAADLAILFEVTGYQAACDDF